MDAAQSLHPTDQTLSSYGLGKLDDRSAEAVNEHLMDCSDCRKRVAEMSADSFLQRVRDAQKPSGKSTSGQPQAGGTQSDKGANTLTSSSGDSLPPELATHPDYEIKRELGRGGMGVVYLAHNTLMGRDEVLKVMGQHLMDHPGVLERFLREIRSVAKLRHPNIVTAYHATRLGQSIVFAMEYVEGLDLSKLVKTKGPMPVAHACLFIHQAALGLQHAHEEGLVHRDIKPHNLMLSRKGDKATVKILDFGLAKAAREEKVEGGLTATGTGPRHPRLHRSRADHRRPDRRHPGRHLQPGRYALLPPDRPPALPGEVALRPLPGPHLPERRSAEPGPPRCALPSLPPWSPR